MNYFLSITSDKTKSNEKATVKTDVYSYLKTFIYWIYSAIVLISSAQDQILIQN